MIGITLIKRRVSDSRSLYPTIEPAIWKETSSLVAEAFRSASTKNLLASNHMYTKRDRNLFLVIMMWPGNILLSHYQYCQKMNSATQMSYRSWIHMKKLLQKYSRPVAKYLTAKQKYTLVAINSPENAFPVRRDFGKMPLLRRNGSSIFLLLLSSSFIYKWPY